MDWVNRLADQKQEAEKRRQRLADGATALFERLNTGVGVAVTVYNQRVVRPNVNEKAHHDAAAHSVEFGVTDAAGAYAASPNTPRVTLTLLAPNVISAVYSGNRTAEIFTAELDDNAYVCLKYDEKTVSIERATEIILGTFLFGDPAVV